MILQFFFINLWHDGTLFYRTIGHRVITFMTCKK